MNAASWLTIAGAALVLAAVVVVGLRRAHTKTDRAAIDAAMQRHPAGTYEASPFSRRPIPDAIAQTGDRLIAHCEAQLDRFVDGVSEALDQYEASLPSHITTEKVTPLDPADLPTVTNDDEALEAMIRSALAGEALPAEIEQRIKDAIEKERDK